MNVKINRLLERCEEVLLRAYPIYEEEAKCQAHMALVRPKLDSIMLRIRNSTDKKVRQSLVDEYNKIAGPQGHADSINMRHELQNCISILKYEVKELNDITPISMSDKNERDNVVCSLEDMIKRIKGVVDGDGICIDSSSGVRKSRPTCLEMLAMYEKDKNGIGSPNAMGLKYAPPSRLTNESKRNWAYREIKKGRKERESLKRSA